MEGVLYLWEAMELRDCDAGVIVHISQIVHNTQCFHILQFIILGETEIFDMEICYSEDRLYDARL